MSSRSSGGWWSAWTRSQPAALLVLMAAILALGSNQPLHVHQGDAPGLYNEAHVLSGQAAVSGDAPLPTAALSAEPAPPSTGPSVPASPKAPGKHARYARSRAPPLH